MARTQQRPSCWHFSERGPTKMPFPMGPTFPSPPGTPPPHVPSGSPGLPTSLPAAVTSRNIFGSSCRRRGDAWPSPRSRRRNAEQSSPPTPGISDVPAQRRFGMATAARPRWGHGRTCPFNPIPTSTSHSHLSACWGLGLVLGPAMGTVSCCLSPAGTGADVARPAASTFLTHMWQLAQFGYVGGLGWCWDGAARAPAAPCPHGARHPRSPPRLSPPRPQVSPSVPQFLHQETRDNDGGITSCWTKVVF